MSCSSRGRRRTRKWCASSAKDVLAEGGKVDRGKLGAMVFADPAKRAKLNWILHPKILDVIRQWFKALDRPGGPEFAVLEAALIYEAGRQ